MDVKMQVDLPDAKIKLICCFRQMEVFPTLSMLKNSENANTRKKLQDYSYCLSHNIGKGYSSTVYKGRNDITDETVAIKVIDMRMLKGEVHKSLLASEIEVLKTFKHARNIIEVYDIYTTKNNTYIITEYCDGGDLSKFISSKRGMPQREAIQYLRQIVTGYSEISTNRVIHRDLKPANILLKNGKIKVADFGFAMKSSDSKKYSSYNVGSPIYMPPEALNDNKYSFKSDVWAIGVIYYELLTGRTPWKAKTEKELGKQLLSVPITKLLPQNLSITSTEFLQKTLCVNYDSRMSPEELESYMQRFDCISGISNSHAKTAHSFLTGSTNITGTQCSIRGIQDEEDVHKRHETSLNKNTINTPKNMRRFTFLKNGTAGNINTMAAIQDTKNASLPKTASTINNNRTQTNMSSQANRKQISKQLLSQVHFCRFVFKLLQRIQAKISNEVSSSLKNNMCGLIFDKLDDIVELNCLGSGSAQYKKSSDYRKICQIASQYQQKYEKDLDVGSGKWDGFDVFENQISNQIKKMFENVRASELEDCQQKVIILDYLITLRQLSSLLAKNDIEMFHGKSKIEAIVQGAPAKVITEQHLRAITAKLKAIKLI